MLRSVPKSFDDSILAKSVQGEIPLSEALQQARHKAQQSLVNEQDLGLPRQELISIAERIVGDTSVFIEESSTALRSQRKLLSQAGITYASPVDIVVEHDSVTERSSLASIIPVAFNGAYLALVIPHERADNKGNEFRDAVELRSVELFSITAKEKVSEVLHGLSEQQKKRRAWALFGTVAIAAGGLANVGLPGAYESYLKFEASRAEAKAIAEKERRSALMEDLYKAHAMLSIDRSKAKQVLESVGLEHYDALAFTLISEPQTIKTLGPVLRDLGSAELLLKRPIFRDKKSSDAREYFDQLTLEVIKTGRDETAREMASILREMSKSGR